MQNTTCLKIGNREISDKAPTYFIADIASNHDGSLERAKKLIRDAKEAGADAVKFQHFLADEIVSDFGFRQLGHQMSHQSKWKDSVYETYKKCECKRSWTEELYDTAKDEGIDFLTTPYDIDAINLFDSLIPAYKIGSGDITWLEFLEEVAKKNKPVILSTGASTLPEVEQAISTIAKYNKNIAILQCNTNYTGDVSNFNYLNLNVISAYKQLFPNYPIGLSDHTPGHVAVLGSVALGARIIEKHFTDDTTRTGPDHLFSMDLKTWREMVDDTRKLESALGNGKKVIEENEADTVIVQRRCLRLNSDKRKGEIVTRRDISVLRPAPSWAIPASMIDRCINRKLKIDVGKDTCLTDEMFE